MALFKTKSMVEKVEGEQAKLRMKQIKLAQMQADGRMRGEKEKMRSVEINRLRA